MKQKFIAEAKLLIRIVTNNGHVPLPKHLNAELIGAHGKLIVRRMQRYKKSIAPQLRHIFKKYRL